MSMFSWRWVARLSGFVAGLVSARLMARLEIRAAQSRCDRKIRSVKRDCKRECQELRKQIADQKTQIREKEMLITTLTDEVTVLGKRVQMLMESEQLARGLVLRWMGEDHEQHE